MNSRPNCQARVIGDQYHCYKCGLVWDVADLDPPDCKTVFIQIPAPIREINVEIKIHREPDPEIEKKEIEKMREIFKHD